MIEIGRVCVKTAGRDANLKCIVVDVLDDKFVLVDGQTRRRKCNILHLEPLKEVIKIKKNASHEDVKKEFEKLGLKVRETNPKQKTKRPMKKRKTPEQLREQKEEKKKLMDLFKRKKEEKVGGKVKEKTEGNKETLEEKAGLVEEKKKQEIKKEKTRENINKEKRD
ncbi:MAG: 50S ribosomal protein L14e [Nanoarchaeota archaeon]|nr:50S ribosomal protein L14e [Nanoarchaeota archaeon]